MGARAACAIVDAALALICTTACIACRGGTLTPTICAENAGEVTVEAEPGTAAGAHATVGAATAGEETAGAATGGGAADMACPPTCFRINFARTDSAATAASLASSSVEALFI